MNEMIKKNGGIAIVSNEEINKVLSWPLYYNSYTQNDTQISKKTFSISNDIEKHLTHFNIYS